MRQTFNEGQEIRFDDLNDIARGADHTLYDSTAQTLMDAPRGFRPGEGFKVYRVSSTTIGINTGFGFGLTTEAMKADDQDPFTTQLIYTDLGDVYVVPAAHATLDRYDRVEVRGYQDYFNTDDRNIKSTLGVITSETVPIQMHWKCAFRIVSGVAGSLEAPDPTDGWEGLAVLHVKAVNALVDDSHIQDIRAILRPETVVIEDQEEFLWDWTTVAGMGATISVSGNFLSIDATVTGATYLLRQPEMLIAALYWELQYYLGQGLSLKINDGAGATWIIKSKAFEFDAYDQGTSGDYKAGLSNYATKCFLAGGTSAVPLCRFRIDCTGTGSTFDIFTNAGSPVMKEVFDWTGFVTQTSVDYGDEPYPLKIVRRGQERAARSIAGVLRNHTAKRLWMRPVAWNSSPAMAADMDGVYVDFEEGHMYEVTMSLNLKKAAPGNVFLSTYFKSLPGGALVGNDIVYGSYEYFPVAAQAVHYNRTFQLFPHNNRNFMTVNLFSSSLLFEGVPGSYGGSLADMHDLFMFSYVMIREL